MFWGCSMQLSFSTVNTELKDLCNMEAISLSLLIILPCSFLFLLYFFFLFLRMWRIRFGLLFSFGKFFFPVHVDSVIFLLLHSLCILEISLWSSLFSVAINFLYAFFWPISFSMILIIQAGFESSLVILIFLGIVALSRASTSRPNSDYYRYFCVSFSHLLLFNLRSRLILEWLPISNVSPTSQLIKSLLVVRTKPRMFLPLVNILSI